MTDDIEELIQRARKEPEEEVELRLSRLFPEAVEGAMASYGRSLDQLQHFDEWEKLETQEIALRYVAHGFDLWSDSMEETDKPDWRCGGGAITDVRGEATTNHGDADDDREQEEVEADDDGSVEANEEYAPASQEAILAPEVAPHLLAWLQEVTGASAPCNVHSPAFPEWARMRRDQKCISRWDVAQLLARARRHPCSAADELLPRQNELYVLLTEFNLRGALHWAARVRGNLPLPLALAAAASGMYRAARAFEPKRGNQFLTLATWWIRQSVARIRDDNSLPLRVPVHRHESLRQLRRALCGLSLDAARQLDDSEALVLLCRHSTREWTLHDVETNRLLDRPQSLTEVFLPTDLECLLDAMFDEFRPAPAEYPMGLVHLDPHARALDRIIEYVEQRPWDNRKKDVLWYRLQLDGRRGRTTLEALGRRYGVTRERIRQIEEKALDEMRHHRWAQDD